MKRYLLALTMLAALVSCGKNPPDKPSGTTPIVVDGVAPVSGKMIPAVLDKGLAPLSFTKTISNICVGYAYSAGKELPDLFFQCPTGVAAANGIDSFLGTSVCEFDGFAKDGSPIYGAPVHVSPVPWGNTSTSVKIMQVSGRILAFYVSSSKVKVAVYDAAAHSFGEAWASESISLLGVGFEPLAFDIIPGSSATAELVLMASDITGTYKPDMDDVSESYYDSAGIYRGKMFYGRLYRLTLDLANWKQIGSVVDLSGGNNVILAPAGVAGFKHGTADGYVCVNKFGVLKYVPRKNTGASEYICDAAGAEVVNPFVSGNVLSLVSASGSDTKWFVVSGEGTPRIYKSAGRSDAAGTPVVEGPFELLMEDGTLYAGSLPVPTVADWDGDGVLDIISGNSEGRLLFFRNYGSNGAPAFGRAEYLCSEGVPICFRAGYYEVQGPFEAAWGYLCPVVFDWDGDGLPDIVFSGNEGKFEYMRNTGSAKAPALGRRQGIFADGLELYGMWRVRPAVARVGSRVLIAMMDGEDALHLYEQTTVNSVKDLGRLTLSDGKYIYGHRENAVNSLGERGREKLEFVDWDGDGDLDLLVGTPLQASVPDPARGLPWSRSTRGLQTLLLENIGSDSNMKFAYPRQFLFRGLDFHIGTHANGPTACMLGDTSDGLPNLLVSGEGGALFFFDRSDLTNITLW